MEQKIIINYCLLLVFTITCFSCNQATETPAMEVTPAATATISEPVKPAQLAGADKNKLIDTWVRTDAPYHLKINGAADDGTLQTEYLNPKPIHVGKATWTSDINGVLNLYVELRDENYPGSNYTLLYIPGKDMLAGKYFQAVEGATYDVEFSRVK